MKAFVFPGQGAQYPGMGKDLYDASDIAKNRFEEYIDMLNDSEYGNFRIECESIHKEKDWSTKELFHYFDIDPFSDIGLNTQLEATHMIFKKNEHDY